MGPKISVLMAVYNGERYVAEAIQSVLGQTFEDFEFIIIDDGSTDGSAAIIEGFDDPRIGYHKNEENIGLTRSLNLGLSIAKGEYIARMDADDISYPDRLLIQSRFLDEHPEIGVVGSNFRYIDETGNVKTTSDLPSSPAFIRWNLLFDSPICHPSVMVRSTVYSSLGGYDETIRYGQDFELWQRAIGITGITNVREQLLGYRDHPGSIFKNFRDDRFDITSGIVVERVSTLAGTKVSQDLVKWLMKPYLIEDRENAGKTVAILIDLCEGFISHEGLAGLEAKGIRRDATSRILLLCRSFRKKNMRSSFTFLMKGFAFDPAGTILLSYGTIRRSFSKRGRGKEAQKDGPGKD